MATPKRKKMNPSYLERLIFKYMRGVLTHLQEKDLSDWRNLSAANEKIFQDATDREKIRKGFKAVCENMEWIKIQQIFPELPRLSKN